MSPEATFDTLSIVAQLEPTVGAVLPGEVHLLAYLACLLSLYSGEPVADWGYAFTGTAEGAPFCSSVSEAIEILRASSDLQYDKSGLKLSEAGRIEYETLRTLRANASREHFISGACSSALTIPLPSVRSAMQQEPALQRVADVAGTRPLLEDTDMDTLCLQFHALQSVIGAEIRDIMLPAVTWLTYLIRISKARPNTLEAP